MIERPDASEAPARPGTVDLATASRRWLWTWDAYLSVCLIGLAMLVYADDVTSLARRTVSVTCLGLIVLSWALVGRRLARDDDLDRDPDTPAAIGYVAAVAVLFIAAVTANGLASFALFAVCPIGFLCLRLWTSLVAATVFNFTPVPVHALQQRSLDQLGPDLGLAVLGLAFTAVIGVSIVSIGKQNAERAQLIAELEASRAEVTDLSHRAGAAAERNRLAAEIHDTLAQGFTSIVTLVQAAETELDADRPAADRHLAMAVRTARENLAEARAMVTVLAPADLRAGTLAEVVRKQVARLAEETGVDAVSSVDDVPADLPTRAQVVLVRAVQESLANIRKHARASSVTVDLFVHADAVTLTVDDDGVGFDVAAQPPGFGLPGMRSRVEQLGGGLTIRSAPGAGTTVTCELPR
ncbi:sensor histidine kinase [Cryptosporangium aurantiacum]|uniref:Oxygen sensor histidine kinase NreB n=1 Tax=Cryptosporangium aurantiacum TaxID=134849 RepID=A0A1M7RIY9_9ACTN|nr:sensor histidine kinase [Cryptosporangium aurantiacum]SHN46234.1 Signal transduction histidine kinase [Cryptosporangium aurantiacum]